MKTKNGKQNSEAGSQKPKSAAAKLADSQTRRGPVYVGVSDEVPVTIRMTKYDKELIKRSLPEWFKVLPADQPGYNTALTLLHKIVRTFEGSYR